MSQNGEWKVEYYSKVVGIHSALLKTGKIILFSYPSKHKNNHHKRDASDDHPHSIFGSASHKGVYQIIDTDNWIGEQPAEIKLNVFCGGHCFLDNSDLFVSGGQYQAIHNPILLVNPPSICTHTFETDENKWNLRHRSFLARWYPTCITLPTGNILIISGAAGIYGLKKIGPISLVNKRLEIYDTQNKLKKLQNLPFKIGLYPFMFILPKHKVFVHSERITRIYDIMTNKWEKSSSNSNNFLEIETNYAYSRTNPVQGTSAILPFTTNSKTAKIMIIGGGGESDDPTLETPATNTCEIIDFDENEPHWKNLPKMNCRRVMPDVVLLPNKKILVLNGTQKGKSDAGTEPVMTPEIYDPIDQSWTTLREMNVPRLYHSTALLLYDGRVITTGTDKEWNVGKEQDEYRVDVFTPPYLTTTTNSSLTRPDIKNVKQEVSYGEDVIVETNLAEEITNVIIVKPSSVTHSLNTDQRCIELEIINVKYDSLVIKMPDDPCIAPPGYYMLFILNKHETPSKSKFIRLQHINKIKV